MSTTLLQLGSGAGFTIDDATDGFGFDEQRIRLYEGRTDEALGETFRSVQWDLRAAARTSTSAAGATVGVRRRLST